MDGVCNQTNGWARPHGRGTDDPEAIKAREVETAVASIIQRSALCLYVLFTVVCHF